MVTKTNSIVLFSIFHADSKYNNCLFIYHQTIQIKCSKSFKQLSKNMKIQNTLAIGKNIFDNLAHNL